MTILGVEVALEDPGSSLVTQHRQSSSSQQPKDMLGSSPRMLTSP